MKRRLNKMRKNLITKLGILGLAAIFLLSMASYSSDQEVTTQGKPGKPRAEWIQFTGDLETPPGGEVVYGCCPNAGPYPQYTMTLTRALGEGTVYEIPAGTYYGQLFINGFGAGRDQKYKVQFWTDNGIGFEIIGGVVDFDRRNKKLTVTFTDELCRDFWYDYIIDRVTFTLVRRPY